MQVANEMKKSIVLPTCHTNELQQDRHAKIFLKVQYWHSYLEGH